MNTKPQEGGPDASKRQALDADIAALKAGEQRWAQTDGPGRSALLAALHEAVGLAAKEWAKTAAEFKGMDPESPFIGEEWTSGPYAVLSALTVLRESVDAIDRGESPVEKTRFGHAPGGRVTVPVLPHNSYEALLLHGFSADVWMLPGVTSGEVRSTAGLGALTPEATGGVGLVLGAGNVTSIPALDVLYSLIAANRVSILKLNPVMDAMGPVFENAYAPLISRGLLRIVSGGGDVGGYLAHHPDISHVHITGSAATHDVVAFGPGEEGRRRKAAGEPSLDKPMTSELGGVSPIIVVPGEWTDADLRYQAEHVVTQRLHNGGYNCIAGQTVLVSSEWPQKDKFLDAIRDVLNEVPTRDAWYPGSDDRVSAALESYPQAERLGPSGQRLLVDVSTDADTMQNTEYFAPVLGFLELPGLEQDFLDQAVKTVNDDFLGTLGANVIVAPETMSSLGHGFDEAIANLRYGTIAINAWTALGFLTAAAPWGAYPGHTLENVESGIGVVHNALLLQNPEKTVVRGPFRPFPRSVRHGEFALFPKPPWFVTARSAAATGRLLTEFAAKPGWLRLPGIFAKAFRA
ncbi:aldehyde dehydrogenase family protein [Arthrobacter roseus]|uniref:aldehyde dehydrogenase family protein n=1 Tax=Arthrobacter roseus TaxID=136274 RepID=UPI0019658C32|nr:aldehyde dehydrogenase family protein [Arthrobacter roseus]MBM7848572.1 aldehyde dehydrogenase (NAD(P)+) [Arthrobacter roseus]